MTAWLEIPFGWLLIIEFFLLFVLVVNEKNVLATLSLFLFGFAAHFLSKINVVTFIKDHVSQIIILFIIYIVLGLLWSFAKWFFFVREKKEEYLELKAKYKNSDKSQESIVREIEYKMGEIPPKANEHKNKIVSWIGYWPISLIWTLLDDFLTKMFKQIYELFAGVFQRISNSQFKGL